MFESSSPNNNSSHTNALRRFPNLTPVQPFGTPWMGPDKSNMSGSYASPLGSPWPSGTDLSSLYVPPVGVGDGGVGRAADPMTRELTDAESYISTHYAISTQPDNSHVLLHKGFPLWNFLEMPGSDSNQMTYKMFPIYWMNQFLAENFRMAQERLKEFVLSTLLDKYPNVLQDLYKAYQRTQGMSFRTKNKKRSAKTTPSFNHNINGNISGDDDGDDDDNSDDPGDSESEDYRGEEFVSSSERTSEGYDSAFLDRIWLEFLYKYMPHEDFFFQEINKDTFWLSTMPSLAAENRVTSKYPSTWHHIYGFRPATPGEDSTYERIFDGVLKQLENPRSVGGGGGGGGGMNLFGGYGISSSHSASNKANKPSHLPLDGLLSIQVAKFKESVEKVSKTAAMINGSRNQDVNSSMTALLRYASEMREEKSQAIQEIREFIYQSLVRPKSHLFSGDTNPIPFLFRGGYYDNFGWLGFVNTVAEDTSTMHSWGQMVLKHQMVKATIEREQQVYNFWGDELPVGTRLYWMVRRKPNPNFTPSYFDDGDYRHPLRQIGQDCEKNSAFLNNCDGFTHPSKPWLSGWFGYGAFEIVPIHFGLKGVDQRSLHYVDIFGKKAIAKLIYVGRVKYDYYSKGGYPLEEREIALGRPGISGVLPTKEMCKRATGKLPFITILTRV